MRALPTVVAKGNIMKNRIARWSGVMAAALLALASQGALAQPGRPGMGRATVPATGFAIENVLASLKGQARASTRRSR